MPFDIEKILKNIPREDLFDTSNRSGTEESFTGKLLFKTYGYTSFPAFREDYSLILPLRDFQNHENLLYGRIDTDFYTIHPKKSKLTQMDSSQNFALQDAAIAFGDLVLDIRKDVASGKIEENIPYISDMKIYKSFHDINVEYNKWVRNVIVGSFPEYTRSFEKDEKITDFETFMKVFSEHLKMIADQLGSINYSSFCISKQSNIRNSGLCIEIADLDFSRDSDKVGFSSNPYFSYFLKKAEKFGFYVDYNAPWRLIFNLASPIITDIPRWSGLRNYFKNNYYLSYKEDLKNLRNFSFNAYRHYRNTTPTTMIEGVDKITGCHKRSLMTRKKILKEEFEKNYTDEYWLKLYIDLKNAEKNLDFNRNEIEKIKKTALDYKKYVDLSRAMSYINSVFQDIPSLEGSYYYDSAKGRYADQDPLPFDDFDGHVKEIVKSYKEK
jgi:hypothetical protein